MASAGLHYTLQHYTLHITQYVVTQTPGPSAASLRDRWWWSSRVWGWLPGAQTGGRPSLCISSGITRLIEECVWSVDVLLLVQITSLAASTSTFISVLMIKQKKYYSLQFTLLPCPCHRRRGVPAGGERCRRWSSPAGPPSWGRGWWWAWPAPAPPPASPATTRPAAPGPAPPGE